MNGPTPLAKAGGPNYNRSETLIGPRESDRRRATGGERPAPWHPAVSETSAETSDRGEHDRWRTTGGERPATGPPGTGDRAPEQPELGKTMQGKPCPRTRPTPHGHRPPGHLRPHDAQIGEPLPRSVAVRWRANGDRSEPMQCERGWLSPHKPDRKHPRLGGPTLGSGPLTMIWNVAAAIAGLRDACRGAWLVEHRTLSVSHTTASGVDITPGSRTPEPHSGHSPIGPRGHTEPLAAGGLRYTGAPVTDSDYSPSGHRPTDRHGGFAGPCTPGH